jgi:hypothetical protein
VPNFRNIAVVVGAASACAFAANRLAAYSAGPPPAHTAGFGEPDCRACHADYELNEPGALLRVDDLPERYQAGMIYPIRVVVRHVELKRAGFQLTARFADGTQAGRFVIPDSLLLRVQGSRGVDYLSHRLAGADQVQGDSISWRFQWVAPASAQRVFFHLAVNVANRDASEFGDRIYTHTAATGGSAQ